MTRSRDPDVRSTIDPSANAQQTRAAQDQARLELSDMAVALRSPEMRRVLWRVLTFCKMGETVLGEGYNGMASLAGQQRVGFLLVSAMEDVDDLVYPQLMSDAKIRKHRADVTAEAARTAAGGDQDETED